MSLILSILSYFMQNRSQNMQQYHERTPLNPYSDHLIQPSSLPFDNQKYRPQPYACHDTSGVNFSQQNTGTYNSSNSGNYADIPNNVDYSNTQPDNFITRENNCYERSANFKNGRQNNCHNGGNFGNFVSHPNLDMQHPNIGQREARGNFSNPNLGQFGRSFPYGSNHYSDGSIIDGDGYRKDPRNCGINLRDILPSPPEQPYGSCEDYR